MKKSFKITFFIVLSVIFISLFCFWFYAAKNDKPENDSKISEQTIIEPKKQPYGALNIELYEEHLVDETGIKKQYFIEENEPFTAFIEIGNYHHIETLCKQYNTDLSVISYDERMKELYIMASFGRKVESVYYKYLDEYGVSALDVTFAEEYNDHMMYVYLMDRIPLWYDCLEGHSYYIMKDDERIYIADCLFDLNENLKEVIKLYFR